MSAAPRASGDHRRRQPCWLPARTRRRRPAFRTVPAWPDFTQHLCSSQTEGLHPMHHPDTHILLQPWVLLVPVLHPETPPWSSARTSFMFILGRFPACERLTDRAARLPGRIAQIRNLGYPDANAFTKFGVSKCARTAQLRVFTCDARAY